MPHSTNDNRKEFVDTYTSHFRFAPFNPEKGQALEWYEVIDRIPAGRAKELVRRVSTGWGERGGSPRIPTFEKAMWAMRQEELGIVKGVPACNWCEYTGWVTFWMMCPDYPTTQNPMFIGLGAFNADEYRACNIYSFATPCSCQRGIKAYCACRDNVDDTTRNMILSKGFETFGAQIQGEMPWTKLTKSHLQSDVQNAEKLNQ